MGTKWAFLDEAGGEIPAWWAQSLEVVHMHPASFPLWLYLFQGLSDFSSSVLHLLFLLPAFELVFVCFLQISHFCPDSNRLLPTLEALALAF